MRDSTDLLILGAGTVGVSVALAAQEAGIDAVLVDRCLPGRETSLGNAGLIEHVANPIFGFPRKPASLLRAALGRDPAVRTRMSALPAFARWLPLYIRESEPARLEASNAALRTLTADAPENHRRWCTASGYDSLQTTGALQYFAGSGIEDELSAAIACGISVRRLNGPTLADAEPILAGQPGEAIEWTHSASVPLPGQLVAAYARLFISRGGRIVEADADRFAAAAQSYQIDTASGVIRAPRAIIALGPWSGGLFARFGYRPPLIGKRGYSRRWHFPSNTLLPRRPIVLNDGGFVVAPAPGGFRVISGVEFSSPGTAPVPSQLLQAERTLQILIPAMRDARPGKIWMGIRPCTPDMRPLIGQVPGTQGLIAATAHNHWGLTTGPVTGALVAAMIAGTAPPVDPAPFAPDRYA